MSTRGFYIFKYMGKYYVFYNGHDSYPHIPYGLCSRLIENLKKFTSKQIIELLEKFILLLDGRKEEYIDDGKTDFISIEDALTRPYEYWRFFVRDQEPTKQRRCDLARGKYNSDLNDMEYVYIMNFDEEIFTINRPHEQIQVHFPLFNIPEDWFDFYERVCKTYDLDFYQY